MRGEDPQLGANRTMVAPQAGALRRPYVGSEARTSSAVTSEIPAIPAGPNYGVLLPDGTIWYPGSQKRLPAPLVLRIIVWSLAFLVLLAGAGDFILHTHPNWADPLRHMVPAALGVVSLATTPKVSGPSSTSSKTTKSHGSSALAFSRSTPQPAGLPGYTTAYTVTGTSAYQIDIKTTNLTWVQACRVVYGVIETSAPIFSGDVQAGQTQTISASSSVDLQVAAGGATVSVLSHGKQIGTVAMPPQVPWHFRFQLASS